MPTICRKYTEQLENRFTKFVELNKNNYQNESHKNHKSSYQNEFQKIANVKIAIRQKQYTSEVVNNAWNAFSLSLD